MGGNQISWWGHAAVQITTGDGTVIFIDPWLSNPAMNGDLQSVGRVDVICISHDHFDHVGDTVGLASRFPCTIVCQPEVAANLKAQGVPEERFVGTGIGMNIGGTVNISGNRITMTQAWHSAASGTAAGFIIRLNNGCTVYHAGDTGIFADMELLGRLYAIDLAVLPIGGHFTMDSYQAAQAAAMIRPAAVMPVHYGTFDLLEKDATVFCELVKRTAPETRPAVIAPGETIEF